MSFKKVSGGSGDSNICCLGSCYILTASDNGVIAEISAAGE